MENPSINGWFEGTWYCKTNNEPWHSRSTSWHNHRIRKHNSASTRTHIKTHPYDPRIDCSKKIEKWNHETLLIELYIYISYIYIYHIYISYIYIYHIYIIYIYIYHIYISYIYIYHIYIYISYIYIYIIYIYHIWSCMIPIKSSRL